MARIDDERKASQETQRQAVEATRAAMQEYIESISKKLHETVVAQAVAQAEAKGPNDVHEILHQIVDEQKAKIEV